MSRVAATSPTRRAVPSAIDGAGVWSVNEPDGTSTWLPGQRPPDRQGDVAVRGHRAGGHRRRSPTATLDGRSTRASGSSTWTWETARTDGVLPGAVADRRLRAASTAGSSSTGVELDHVVLSRADIGDLDQLRSTRRSPTDVLRRAVRRLPVRPVRDGARRLGSRAGDGDPGPAAVQRDRSRRLARVPRSSCCWPTSWRISGSATRSRPPSGTTSGSTRDSRRTANGCGSTTIGIRHASTAWRTRRCSETARREVARSADPDELFGAVSYDGGGAVLHALRLTIGDDGVLRGRAGVGGASTSTRRPPTDDFQATMESRERTRSRRRSSPPGSMPTTDPTASPTRADGQ